jgi:hypothetical protein
MLKLTTKYLIQLGKPLNYKEKHQYSIFLWNVRHNHANMLFGTRRQILQLDTDTLSTVFRITMFECSYGRWGCSSKNTSNFCAYCNGVLFEIYNYFHDKYWHLELFFNTHNNITVV